MLLSIESRMPAAHNNPYAKIAYSDPPQVLMPFVAKRTVPSERGREGDHGLLHLYCLRVK